MNDRGCGSVSWASPNGCGSTWYQQAVIPEEIEGVNIASACDNHDVCYGTAGSNRYECDARLGDDIRHACESPSSRANWCYEGMDLNLHGAELDNYVTENVYQCTGAASIYQGAVASFGESAFESAQINGQCAALRSLQASLGCQ